MPCDCINEENLDEDLDELCMFKELRLASASARFACVQHYFDLTICFSGLGLLAAKVSL